MGTKCPVVHSLWSLWATPFVHSGDLGTLIVALAPMRAVFVMKFFGRLREACVLMLVLLPPALVGYGQGIGFGPTLKRDATALSG